MNHLCLYLNSCDLSWLKQCAASVKVASVLTVLYCMAAGTWLLHECSMLYYSKITVMKKKSEKVVGLLSGICFFLIIKKPCIDIR